MELCLSQVGQVDYGGGRAGWTGSILCVKEPVALSSGRQSRYIDSRRFIEEESFAISPTFVLRELWILCT